MSEAEALERLRAILARPEFQSDGTRSWWQQLQRAIFELLFNLWAQFAQTVAGAADGREGWLGLVALGIGAVGATLAIAYLARSVRLAVLRESRLAAETRAERRERSDRLWASAHELAAAGDWPGAVRAAYLSALYALDEHALLHIQSGLTNREHATRLAHDHPEVGSTFAELVLRYDRVRYGGVPATAEAFADLSELVTRARAPGAA